MHSILLVIEKPYDKEKLHHLWPTILTQSQNIISSAKGMKTLGENVWMMPLDDGQLTLVSEVIALASPKGILCRTLFFRKEPQWVYSSKTS